MSRNHWRSAAVEQIAFPPLTDNITVDLVVIGGGFTGLNAARVAAREGLRVCLIEAETIGHGGSGRNVGLVNAGLWLPPDQIKETLGDTRGERLINDLGVGPDRVFDLIKSYEIQCDARRNGTLHLAHSSQAISDLRAREEQWKNRGVPVTLLDAQTTARHVGSDMYHGALFDARAGVIQPLDYARGLARAAANKGVQIHEKTAAVRIEWDDIWQVTTGDGHVRASKLLIATNAYNKLTSATRVYETSIVSYFQCVSQKIAQRDFDTILSDHHGCWDTAVIMSSFRKTRDNRLVFGAMGETSGTLGRYIHDGWAQRAIQRIFPNLRIELSQSWSGRIAMTKKKIPNIMRLGKDGYAIFGYSGRGIAPGTVLGEQFGKYSATEDESVLCLKITDKYHETFTNLKSRYYESGARVFHVINDR
ncbi:MAG: FAD-binding oxidoreductase [Paracoccaceae bacterium]|jgi:glycine/D-amino acid oxidase-like deaminating enzyme